VAAQPLNPQNVADTLAVQLERIEKKISVLYEVEDTFYSQVEKSTDAVQVNTRDMKIPVQFAPGGYFGQYNPDGGNLGRGSGPRYENAVIPIVDFRYALEWTKKSEWATSGSTQSIINTFNKNMAAAMPHFRAHMDSMCMTGGKGVLGTITAYSTAGGFDTVVLDVDFGVKLLMEGQKINIYNSAMALQKTVLGEEPEINFRDVPTKTIRFAAVSGANGVPAVGDKIVIEGVSGPDPISLLGVPYHVNNSSTGTWLGFTRSSTPAIRASRVDAGGSGLSLPFPRLALNLLGDRSNNTMKMPNVKAWMHPAQAAAYESLGMLVTTIDKDSNGSQGMDLYFGGKMTMAGVPIQQSYKWDKRRIDFLNMDSWGRAELKKPGFYTSDGRKLFEVRGLDGGVVTSTLLYLVASWNLFTSNPQENAYIDNLAIPAGYA
jgi:hypothetical protein